MTRYLPAHEVRAAARKRVLSGIGDDTRVVVAHSLGSVVACEARCSAPVPLGARPDGEDLAWRNVVDHGDVVALLKDPRTRFGPRVEGVALHRGAPAHDVTAHDVTAHLTDVRTGVAISGGLRVR
ncbi:hypothetical protein ACFS5L_17045 [Streptomyces phyllanthi]|uniref:Uncharacterized protein n=1 Tax=Streptomyces phyllanthi TaxID=1803180 RepID=A0A5N8WCZ7_9ACTN|nr:hypothetical protein [Streptomyces phyllanthi]MPY45343.1 hypothetical protein [Streptomyces phyllanthi]